MVVLIHQICSAAKARAKTPMRSTLKWRRVQTNHARSDQPSPKRGEGLNLRTDPADCRGRQMPSSKPATGATKKLADRTNNAPRQAKR